MKFNSPDNNRSRYMKFNHTVNRFGWQENELQKLKNDDEWNNEKNKHKTCLSIRHLMNNIYNKVKLKLQMKRMWAGVKAEAGA